MATFEVRLKNTKNCVIYLSEEIKNAFQIELDKHPLLERGKIATETSHYSLYTNAQIPKAAAKALLTTLPVIPSSVS